MIAQSRLLNFPGMTNLYSSPNHAIQDHATRKDRNPILDSKLEQESPRSAILTMVMYFDVFRHPLTVPELVRLIRPGDPKTIQDALDRLVQCGILECQDTFVFRKGMSEIVLRRRVRARSAESIWPKARRAAQWLYRIPQVRGLMVTGSLSKNSTQSKDDIDFMVLVEPGQVWTLKTLLQGMRRAMPEGIRECFCTNYLLDISHPRIDDQNLFTAIELATAMPMAGRTAILEFLEANHHWVHQFVPGFDWSIERAQRLSPDPMSGIRFPTSVWLERKAMSLWSHYWDRKYNWLDPETRNQRFKRRPEVATNHLHDFQDFVQAEVERRLQPLGLNLRTLTAED